MYINRLRSMLFPKTTNIGDLYKESKNGIKVYRKVNNDGSVRLSSFFSDGTPFKTIEKRYINNILFGRYDIKGSVKGHITEVTNHVTGIKTHIKKIIREYSSPVVEYIDGIRLKMKSGDVAKKFVLNREKNGNNIGKLIYFEEYPDYGVKINSEYDNLGNKISVETAKFNIIK